MASLNIMARGHGCLGVETFLLVNKQVKTTVSTFDKTSLTDLMCVERMFL